MIQNDQMTRAEALERARAFDGEFPAEFLDEMLAYLAMTRAELLDVIDKHRNPELWSKEDGHWRLMHPIG
jgi:hypothetical protein